MDKNKALDAALSQIEKAFGKGSIMRMGQAAHSDIEAVSTGSLGIDMALGIGGLPKGRIVEIYGPESSGKTTLALSVIAQAQKTGGTCAFIDAEHALDPAYAKKIGAKYVTTVMTVSPHKNSKKIAEIGNSIASDFDGIEYLFIDFKKEDGYKKTNILANEADLYRQNYCGCLYSEFERHVKKLKKQVQN